MKYQTIYFYGMPVWNWDPCPSTLMCSFASHHFR